MTVPHRSGEQSTAAARGVVLLVVAVVVGAFLLARGNSGSLLGSRGESGGGGGGPVTQQSTTTTSSPMTTPTTTKAAAATKVAIFNATGGKVQSAAGNSRVKLVSIGYTQANVSINDTAQRSTSVVYYQSTVTSADAAVVASALQLPNTSVQPVGTATLPAPAKGYDVVVLIGLDAQTNPVITGAATGSTTSSTSTTAPTTSTTG